MSYIPYTTTPTGFSQAEYNYGLSYDGNGNIWITNVLLELLSIINVRTNAITIISTGTYYNIYNPDSLCYDGTYMWLTDLKTYQVVIINPLYPYTVVRSFIVSGACSLIFDNTNMWLLYEYNSSVDIINVTMYNTISNINLSSYITDVSGIGFDGTYIWILSNNTTYITLYTASIQTYHSQLTKNYGFSSVPGNSYYCLYKDNNMWITSAWGQVFSIINTTTYELIATYPGSVYGIFGPSGIGYDSINNKIWIIDWYYSTNAYILDNITNPITGYSVKVNGVETDLSLIFKSISLGTKSTIPTNYNVSGYGDLNNIFAALDGGTPLTYNTLYSVNVDGVQKDLSEIFLPF